MLLTTSNTIELKKKRNEIRIVFAGLFDYKA